MVATAAHLVDAVFPQVPMCQWVLSFPNVIYDPNSRWMAMTDPSGRRITVHRLHQEATIDDYGILQWQIEDLRF